MTDQELAEWEVNVSEAHFYKSGASWGKDEYTRTEVRYAVVIPAETPEETVLVAEINRTTRNPWRAPADPKATADRIVRAVNSFDELLAACLEAARVINAHTTEPIPVGIGNRISRILSDAIRHADPA